MERLCQKELCTGCGACAAACPKNCIAMEPDSEGFLRPVIREEDCVHCGLCGKICPIRLPREEGAGETAAYGAMSHDRETRLASTSGGIFTLLCRWVLDRGGVIFGAAWGEDFSVTHCRVESPADIGRLRGAKYAQSALGDTFVQVRECLEQGKTVLFSGTPCQVGGLKAYLGKDYVNLILVDLICHGVPSPAVWQHYLQYRSQTDARGEKPIAVNLRSKESGWPGYAARFEYGDGTVYSALNRQDPYLRGFVGGLYMRPSCHDCHFKGIRRQSDFTLGDYWGVWDRQPHLHDGAGTSLVLLHTDRAMEIWQRLSPEMEYQVVNAADALAENPSALVSAALTEKREIFFETWRNRDFSALVEQLCPLPPPPQKPSFAKRVIRKLRSLIQ